MMNQYTFTLFARCIDLLTRTHGGETTTLTEASDLLLNVAQASTLPGQLLNDGSGHHMTY